MQTMNETKGNISNAYVDNVIKNRHLHQVLYLQKIKNKINFYLYSVYTFKIKQNHWRERKRERKKIITVNKKITWSTCETTNCELKKCFRKVGAQGDDEPTSLKIWLVPVSDVLK